NKFAIARTVLTKLNEDGESALGVRREVLKRVVEFEDFSACWSGDQLEVQGLVHRIRHIVGVKDSFPRMQTEALVYPGRLWPKCSITGERDGDESGRNRMPVSRSR